MINPRTERTRPSRPTHVRRGGPASATSVLGLVVVLAAFAVVVAGVLSFGAGRNPSTGVVASPSPAPTEQPAVSPSADPSVAPSPSVQPEPSADPSVEPSAAPSQPAPSDEPAEPYVPADLGPDRIGRVVASDGLRVRTLPTVGEESQRLDPTLDEGTKFYVVDGPVMADGYAWYQVDPYGTSDAAVPFGWIAAGSREGDAWIENHLDGCDSMGATIETVGAMWPQEQLFCYGSDELELTGQLVCDFGDIEGLPNGPAWVEFDRFCDLRAPDWNIHDGVGLRVWGQAATSLLDEGSPVDGQYTVVGHFDDAGASECEGGGFDGDRDPAETVLVCRMAFVVTEVRPA